MITFDQLSDKYQVQIMQKHVIYFMVLLKSVSKKSFSRVSDENILLSLSFLSVPFLILELNCSKTKPRKLKVKFYSYK